MPPKADGTPGTPSTLRRIVLSAKLGLVVLLVLALGAGGIWLAWRLWDWLIGLFE